MVPSYLISFLSTRALLLKDQFPTKHPGSWLVWEPGNWHAPAIAASVAKTLGPQERPTTPAKGDALCFQLSSLGNKQSLKAGRDPGSDLVLNDATVSREHLLLLYEGRNVWSAQPLA